MMEMVEMMELLLKEIRACQENADAMREDIRSNQEKAEANRKVDQEDFLARLEADRQANMEAWR